MSRVVDLTRSLIACETVNPPGNESRCADLVAPVLASAGFELERHVLAEGRDSLIARRTGADPRMPALCLTGHLDTVGFGGAWSHDPIGGEVSDGRIYGRGASDMKGGVAAMLAACERLGGLEVGTRGLEVVLCASEETGCDGAKALTAELGNVGAVLVAEPTANRPLVAHKGALWLEARSHGKSAHGSTPQLGENAIYSMAHAVRELESCGLQASEHPLLGGPTLNVGTIRGGLSINTVPDSCAIGIDIRTVPGLSHESVRDLLRKRLGEAFDLRTLIDLPAVASDPDDGFVRGVFEVVERLTAQPNWPGGAGYFTDASVLVPAYGHPPTVVLGPGEADQAHQGDESCSIAALELAAELYFEIARHWCEM